MIYGYARVSTPKQANDCNGLEAQEKELKDNGATKIYYDSFTGTKTDRPALNELLSVVQSGDTIMVTKLDRLGRSVSQTTELIDVLIAKGITINVINLGILSKSSMSTFMRNMLLAFAQLERDLILERTSEGKAIKREKGELDEGRPRIETLDFQKFLKKQKDGEMTVKECCEVLGISRATWYNRVAEVG